MKTVLLFFFFWQKPTEVGFNIPYNAMNNAYPAQVIRQELGSMGMPSMMR